MSKDLLDALECAAWGLAATAFLTACGMANQDKQDYEANRAHICTAVAKGRISAEAQEILTGENGEFDCSDFESIPRLTL